MGQFAGIDAFPQLQQPVFSGLGVGKTLERGSGGTEQTDGPGELCAHDCDVAPMVARGFVLFVSRLVLLIDDHQSKILHGRKDRRARADDHPGHARREREPAIQPFALREMAVPHHAAVIRGNGLEPRPQPRHRLGCQRDLRYEKNHTAPALQRLCNCPQINLRLPRSRHTVQQRHPEFSAGQFLVERGNGRRLLGVGRMRLRRHQLAFGKVIGVSDALESPGLFADDPSFHKPDRNGRRHAQPAQDQGLLLWPELLRQQAIEPRLLRRPFLDHADFLRGEPPYHGEQLLLLESRAVPDRRRQHGFNNAVQTARIITCHPPRQREQVRRQGGKGMQELRDGL